MRIMAVDFGDSRTGLAICDKAEFLASPLTVVQEKHFERCAQAVAAHAKEQKAKGKRKGPGSRKGTDNARVSDKRRWISTIRPIRDELKQLRADGKITPSVYRLYYRRAKGGVYKNRRNLRMHMINAGHLKEEEI